MRLWKSGLLALACGVLTGGFYTGCTDSTRDGKPTVEKQDLVTAPVYPALVGTIGQYAIVGTNQPIRVEGYGIVANLPDTGSNYMPAEVRDVLADLLYKAGANRETGISPDQLLRTNKISLVQVHGYIPPMTLRGGHFDLSVIAYPGSQTTSLEHGLLWTTELRVIGLAGSAFETRVISHGRGQVYCEPNIPEIQNNKSPAIPANAPSHRNLRRGRVLSGGSVLENMPAQIQLLVPSRSSSKMIERLINSRYPSMKPYANALNESIIDIRIPENYKETPQDFMNQILHMYLAMDVPGFVEKKANEIITALHDPKAPHEELAMALQGLGKTIIDPILRSHYNDPDLRVRYYCAVVGASLEDIQGQIVLEDFAKNPQNPFCLAAVGAMGRIGHDSPSLRITTVLSNLLNEADTPVRLAAYQSLRFMRSERIKSMGAQQGLRRFDVDYVDSTGPNLIYATQTGRERIAVIGSKFDLAPGFLFISPDGLLTISVPDSPAAIPPDAPKDQPVMLYYRTPLGDRTPKVFAKSSLPVVLAKLSYEPDPFSDRYSAKEQFISLPYQKMIESLSAMCREKMVDAAFVLQKAPVIDPSPTALMEDGRPEGFITTTAPAPATKPAK